MQKRIVVFAIAGAMCLSQTERAEATKELVPKTGLATIHTFGCPEGNGQKKAGKGGRWAPAFAAGSRPKRQASASAEDVGGGISPQSIELNRQGVQMARDGKVGDAIELWQESLRADPRNQEPAFNLAYAYDTEEDKERAIEAYCHYLGLASDRATADRAWSRLLELSPYPRYVTPKALMHFNTATKAAGAGDLEHAASQYSKSIKRAREWPAPYFNRALVNRAALKPTAAAKDLSRYLRAHPQAPDRQRVMEEIHRLDEVAGGMRSQATAMFLEFFIPSAGFIYAGAPGKGIWLVFVRGLMAAGGAVGGALGSPEDPDTGLALGAAGGFLFAHVLTVPSARWEVKKHNNRVWKRYMARRRPLPGGPTPLFSLAIDFR